jgi:regulator of replication initiation timing
LEAFVKELKESIEELMEVKNHLMMENRKLVAILKKKEQN